MSVGKIQRCLASQHVGKKQWSSSGIYSVQLCVFTNCQEAVSYTL